MGEVTVLEEGCHKIRREGTLSSPFYGINSRGHTCFSEKVCAADNEFPCFLFRHGTFSKYGESVRGINPFQLSEEE